MEAPLETPAEEKKLEQPETDNTNNFKDRPRNFVKKPAPQNKPALISDFLAPFAQFSDVPTIKKELIDISKSNSGYNAGISKKCISRATEVSLELVKKYEAQKKQIDVYQKNDSIYQSLKNEYVTGTSSYEALINHYESLVKQLTAENDLIKQVLKQKQITIEGLPEDSKNKGKSKDKPSNGVKKTKQTAENTQPPANTSEEVV